MLKPKIAKRKFYDKWLYKVTLTFDGANVLRQYSPEKILEMYKSDTYTNMGRYCFLAYSKNIDLINKISETLVSSGEPRQLRLEHTSIDVYTNSKELYDQLSIEFESILKHRYEPNPLADSTSDNIVTDKLPHGRYQYKIFLKPHLMANSTDEKTKYLNWIKGQGDKISMSMSVRGWFLTTNWNWDRRYIWVEDEQTLLMLKLRNAAVVGKIHRYTLADK
jgi:hypothetical protein